MRRGGRLATIVVLGAMGGALLGGCGSQTKTVSVASAPPASSEATTTSTSPAATTTTTQSTQTTTTSTTATSSSGARSATEPAFTEHATAGSAASSAQATVRAQGFTAGNPSEYHAHQTLAVLIGTNAGSGDGYDQRAFFFVNGKYIGTDSSKPSADVRVASQSDTEITLAYRLYRPNDALCCPGGGVTKVRFQLNDGKLTPLDPIPPESSKTGLSRQ